MCPRCRRSSVSPPPPPPPPLPHFPPRFSPTPTHAPFRTADRPPPPCLSFLPGAPDTGPERTSGRKAQTANIHASKTVSDVIRTCLGPKAMLKMILDPMGGIVLTNDGNSILREIEVAHPAAKSMIELSRTQDEEVGDGTTSVIILGTFSPPAPLRFRSASCARRGGRERGGGASVGRYPLRSAGAKSGTLARTRVPPSRSPATPPASPADPIAAASERRRGGGG